MGQMPLGESKKKKNTKRNKTKNNNNNSDNNTKKLYRTESGEKISYFKLPDDMNLKKRWLRAIRRDEGKEFSVNQNTKICLRKPEDFVKAIGGQRIYVREGVVPSRFSWSQSSTKKRTSPKRRRSLSTT